MFILALVVLFTGVKWTLLVYIRRADETQNPFPFKMAIKVQDGVVSDPRNTVSSSAGMRLRQTTRLLRVHISMERKH